MRTLLTSVVGTLSVGFAAHAADTVTIASGDAACKSMAQIEAQFEALIRKDYAAAMPPGPPECVDVERDEIYPIAGDVVDVPLGDDTVAMVPIDVYGTKRWILLSNLNETREEIEAED